MLTSKNSCLKFFSCLPNACNAVLFFYIVFFRTTPWYTIEGELGINLVIFLDTFQAFLDLHVTHHVFLFSIFIFLIRFSFVNTIWILYYVPSSSSLKVSILFRVSYGHFFTLLFVWITFFLLFFKYNVSILFFYLLFCRSWNVCSVWFLNCHLYFCF